MKWLVLLRLVALSECIVVIPVTKMKTLQEVVLEEIKPKYFLEEQSYSLYPPLVLAGKHLRYNPKAYSIFQSGHGKHINLCYGCGRIVGVLATDTVRIIYPSLAIHRTTLIFDNLNKNRIISEPVFAFFISSCPQKSSLLMLGRVDHAYHKGALKWVPVTQARLWQITMDREPLKSSLLMLGGVDHAYHNGALGTGDPIPLMADNHEP
ncbi:hypothetical protein MJT46_016486 [Ovis ammon polii x Ovis aries]|nr:hypothetical protein MJT46_016486 [Ovis ammon polii x Ovis aries]